MYGAPVCGELLARGEPLLDVCVAACLAAVQSGCGLRTRSLSGSLTLDGVCMQASHFPSVFPLRWQQEGAEMGLVCLDNPALLGYPSGKLHSGRRLLSSPLLSQQQPDGTGTTFSFFPTLGLLGQAVCLRSGLCCARARWHVRAMRGRFVFPHGPGWASR